MWIIERKINGEWQQVGESKKTKTEVRKLRKLILSRTGTPNQLNKFLREKKL